MCQKVLEQGYGSQEDLRTSAFHLFCLFKFIPIGSMYAIYMVTFTINIPQMLAYIAYMDPVGYNT